MRILRPSRAPRPAPRTQPRPCSNTPSITFDDLGVARCPKCDMPMALCYTRRGPAFVCRCPAHRAA